MTHGSSSGISPTEQVAPANKRLPARSVVLPLTALLVAAVLTVCAALVARYREPNEWRSDDWAAVAGGLFLGLFFLALTQLLQRRQTALQEQIAETQQTQVVLQEQMVETQRTQVLMQDQMAETQRTQVVLQDQQHRISRGLSNAVLQEKVGNLAVSSVRSFTGTADESLKVAPEALAAMQLFELAGTPEQAKFLDTLFDAYSTMTINAFIRTKSLPLAAARRLQSDGDELRGELKRAASRDRHESVERLLSKLDQHVELCLGLEANWRNHSGGDSVEGLPQGCLRGLYRRELLVYHNWDVSGADSMQAFCEVYEDISRLADYYSPWYARRAGNAYEEVNFVKRLRSPELFTSSEVLPEHPVPLQHRQILGTGLRENGIAHMVRRLEAVRPRAMALLVYELPDRRRLVLDGNHRLAAALRMHAAGQWELRDELPSHIAVFVLREMSGHRPVGYNEKEASSGHIDSWHGFNPDVENLRGVPVRSAKPTHRSS